MSKTISQMMDIVLAEVVKELRKRNRLEGLCAKSIYPGLGVPLDYGAESCGGMTWVQLQSAVPSSDFPNQASGADTCVYGLAYTIQVGIMRPIALPSERRGQIALPTDEQNAQSTYEQMEDMDALHQAIRSSSEDIENVILGQYIPQGPEGGVAGGVWNVTVGDDY